MAEFSELIKNFNKIRDFMRDFYIYGFKSRDDFSIKSARTYDNEKRRCESYLGQSMKWSYTGVGNKVSFVSADCGKLSTNPLFSAWKSKSFTKNDIMLHFYILDAVRETDKSAEELTEEITQKSETLFDLQTVRGKCNEYTTAGILMRTKKGKAFRYALAQNPIALDEEILNAVKFFQSGVLGVVGDYILDSVSAENDLFTFKHQYIAHTLEDGVLYDILTAIREQKNISFSLIGTKNGAATEKQVFPVKILCSHSSGRRFLCGYSRLHRFTVYRLDAVKAVKILEAAESPQEILHSFNRNIGKLWGVSFDAKDRNQAFSLTLHIDEGREQHIINRILKESRGGTLERIRENTFLFTKDVFDSVEASPWIKTFIGRIISIEGHEYLKHRLQSDICRMAALYQIEGAADGEVPT
ncbi:MAG: WYL domain-containing protein [Firmicutes bacterium]|nr:WYL domain-containing protein [Bacillota bacterium]